MVEIVRQTRFSRTPTGKPTPLAVLQGQRQKAQSGEIVLQQQREQAKLDSLISGARRLKSIKDPTQQMAELQRRRADLVAQGVDTGETDQGIELLQQGDLEGFNESLDSILSLAPQGQFTLSPGQTRFVGGREVASVAPTPVRQSASGVQFKALTEGLSEEDELLARRIDLGLDPRAVGSGAITTAKTEGLAEQVATSEGIIAGAKEQAKLKKKLTFAPQIAKAVKVAEEEGKARGEAITDLTRAKAAMPGLLSAIGQLKELAPIATSTLGGRAFDFAVKESGFGSTKGANAKAKFIAIINNQVLPLLKPTFGAAFTVQEGESLKATMGDPNATPSQKLEQLDAFIDQKFRNMQALETEIGETSTEFKDVSDDDLLSF